MSAPVAGSFSRSFLVFLMIFHSIRLYHCARNRKLFTFATKTKYDAVVDGIFRKTLDGQPTLHPPNCKVLQVNNVVRHGYRYPSIKDLINFDKLHERKIKGKVRAEEFRFLNDWSSPFNKHEEKDLVNLGVIEIQNIAARFQKNLLKFPSSVSEEDIKLISSDTQRTVATAKAFRDGILGEADATTDPEDFRIDIDNILLRFYDYCPTYLRVVKNNKTALAEMHRFKDGKLMQEITKNVSSRLGLVDVLKPGDLKSISLIAAYEEAIYGSSLWMDVLTEDELEIVEYVTELKSYWRKAYGYEMNYIMSCPLISNIFKYMDQAIEADFQGTRTYKGVFRFGHAETLFPLIATMGLFKPREPLTADNYHKADERLFRSSIISPMSGNVAIVLYSCDPDMAVIHDIPEWPHEYSQFMVQVLVNEQVVKLPFCEHTLCPYEEFQSHYNSYVSQCQFDQMCAVHGKRDEL